METHTGSQFVRDLENIPQVSAIGGWRCCRIDSNRTTRHTGCRFARHLETHTGSQFVRDLENIPQVSVKGGCRYCQIDTIQLDSNDSSPQMTTRHTGCNLHPVWRIVICCDESFDLSRIVSNRQHLLHCIVYNILTIDFRSSQAGWRERESIFMIKPLFKSFDQVISRNFYRRNCFWTSLQPLPIRCLVVWRW